jgi:hypothetical protein
MLAGGGGALGGGGKKQRYGTFGGHGGCGEVSRLHVALAMPKVAHSPAQSAYG